VKKKVPLARTLRWEARTPFMEIDRVARFWVRAPYLECKDVRGKVAEQILALGGAGRATFLDKPPVDPTGYLMVVGYQNGVVIHYFTNGGFAYTHTMRMCAPFRNRLVGGAGKVRWAKVKAA